MGLIINNDKKWVNGTELRYYFFNEDRDRSVQFRGGERILLSWKGTEEEKEVVRRAFREWADIGIGLKFEEVLTREEAEIRIGFLDGDGAWSYIGRDVLSIPSNDRTMNFGWDISKSRDGYDTALHEIGHTLGFPHEHQNPFSGIVWDENTVYSKLAGYPNYWSQEKTYHNIIRKLDPDTVQGSNWDPDSIMHYPFEAGMILSPAQYNRNGLFPQGGLSSRDREWVKHFYPPIPKEEEENELKPMESQTFNLEPSEQKNFLFIPDTTRNYTIKTFGEMDTVMVLFEEVDGKMRYRQGDDDSGEDFNAEIQMKLIAGHRYVIRIRMYFKFQSGSTAVMVY